VSVLTGKFGSIFKLGGLALVLLSALALAVVPFSKTLIEEWSRGELESRARLVDYAIHGTVVRAVGERAWGRLGTIFEGVAQGERILAVGLCDERGVLRSPTNHMPRTFSCEKVAGSERESFSTIVSHGSTVLVASFPVGVRDRKARLVVLQDLSFIDARSRETQRFVLATLLGVGAIIVAIAAMLVVFARRGWTASLRQAIDDVRWRRPPSTRHRDRSAVDMQIQQLMKELDTSRAPTEAAQIEWSPQSLHDLLGKALPGAEVIIVSNREPYIHNRTDAGVELQTPASGLVSALEPVMQACGGTWIAQGSGTADRDVVDANDRIDVPPSAPAYKLRRIWITDEEQDGYYYGLANEGLWPLCHIAFVRPVFDEANWNIYEAINARFAEAVAQEARTEDPIVLVQDYHLALAPRMIRKLLPKATIITFWHIPWPNAETFGIFPWKEKLLEGLLGSTILGFHTQFHCNNFLETIDRFVESRIDREHATVTFEGHETMIRPYPISIEWPPKALAGQASVEDCRSTVRKRFGISADAKLGVGVERFDYTKGILDRMRAIDLLLSFYPEWKERFTFVQVAAPTRSKLLGYRTLQDEALALAQDINERHGNGSYQPIRLIIRQHDAAAVFELFRAADLCIVSSLHDGMNLVAKEFVASRDDDEGVLVLSSFAGASRELSEALIVNPYHGQQMAAALDTALRMPSKEQRERMHLMRQQVREQNVYRWAGRMLVDAAQVRQRRRILELAGPGRRSRR
jgi:trehalose 6-phosphate synthase